MDMTQNTTHFEDGLIPAQTTLNTFILPICLTALTLILLLRYSLLAPEVMKVNHPPIVPGLPILGNILQLDVMSPHTTFTEWARKYGGQYMIKVFTEPILVLNDYESIRAALVDQVRFLNVQHRGKKKYCFNIKLHRKHTYEGIISLYNYIFYTHPLNSDINYYNIVFQAQ